MEDKSNSERKKLSLSLGGKLTLKNPIPSSKLPSSVTTNARSGRSTVQVEVKSLRAGAFPALIKTDTPAMQSAIKAYEKGWGAVPIFKREGGSIPIVSDFQSVLNLPVIMMGFGLNSDNLHGPNERFNLEMFHKGIATSIYFLREVAALPNTHSESDQS